LLDIGITELVVVAALALVVLGPEKLPLFFRTIGTLIGRAQSYVSDVKDDIQKQIELEGLSNTKQVISEISNEVTENITSLDEDFLEITEGIKKNIQPDGDLEKKRGFFVGSPPLSWPEENSYIRLRDRLRKRNRQRLLKIRKL
jgi:sec-independent protein translocase protein TatB